jgi:6-phosphogluconolactonase
VSGVSVEIEVVEKPARACAAMMVGAAAGGGDVVLTGGSTPATAYEEFANAVNSVGVDLTDTRFWFGDERCVSSDDERSNFRMARQSLFDRLARGNEPIVCRMKGELGASAAADDYESTLREAGPPEFDLLLLGIGPDGHMASLFPDQPSLNERSRLVLGVEEAGMEPYVPRVTLTIAALCCSRQVLFLATGSSKAEAVAAAFGPNAKPDPHIPSSILPSVADEVTVLLDPAAAERL